MFWFWLLFLIPALIALLSIEKTRRVGLVPWVFIGGLFSFAIGFRFQVGGDWGTYLRHYDRYAFYDLMEILVESDPGYAFTNWFSAQWGWGIYGVNLICGTIFMVGLLILCRQQQRPWLGFAVAVPYVLVVVAMGYTRQAVALGFLMWAIASLERGAFTRYLVLIVCAAFFHKTALVMIPLGIFLNKKGRLIRGISVLLVGYVLWDLLLASQQAHLWHNYVEAQMESSGARIRVVMNLVPALLFLLYRKRWKETYTNYGFWMAFSMCAIASIFLVSFASTAVDRVALYFTPLQIVVLARLPDLARKQFSPQFMTTGILLVYGLVLFVWLNYATHARYWLPYQNGLFL